MKVEMILMFKLQKKTLQVILMIQMMIVINCWNYVVEIKSYQGTCRVKALDCRKLELCC